jgi:tRNA pseudouridine38-40 synthase
VPALRGRVHGDQTRLARIRRKANLKVRLYGFASTTVRTLKLTLSYDGTRLVGWQRQADGESVQGVLEDALARFEGAPVTVHGAGRTDAGVHALGQVASVGVTFTHDVSTLARALNAHLPEDVRVLSVEDAPPGFHARFDARSKTYRYYIRNGPLASPFERQFVWHVPQPLDVDAMRQAASRLLGRHDFSAFRSSGTEVPDSVRTLHTSAVVETAGAVPWLVSTATTTPSASRCSSDAGSVLTYEVTGDGFLRHMVRAIVGTLVEVGRGWRDAAQMDALLQSGDRARAGATAPPQGLFLVRVDYD